MSEKERRKTGIDKSIRGNKVNYTRESNQDKINGNKPVVKFGDVGRDSNFSQTNYVVINNYNSQKEKEGKSADKLKTSEKSINEIVKEKIQKSKLKTEVLEELSKELEDEINKEKD